MKRTIRYCRIVALAAIAALAGCKADATQEQRMQTIRQLADIARDHGLSGTLTIDVDGSPSVGMTQDFYLDTGVRARAIFNFNSATARGIEPTGGGQ